MCERKRYQQWQRDRLNRRQKLVLAAIFFAGAFVPLLFRPAYAADPSSSLAPGASLHAPDRLDPGQPFSATITLQSVAPTTCVITYSLQTDSTLADEQPPDPIYGSDRAIGCRSWTEVDGKVIEEGSLTDGKDYTDASTSWINDHFTEVFQYVDLGRVRRIQRITYGSGDANHSWKLDAAVSTDGKNYSPAPGLQDFDTHQKWGNVILPLGQPVTARFIRLRYHNDGQKEPVFRMPTRLSVYDGAAGENWRLPRLPDSALIGKGAATVKLAAGRPENVSIAIPHPLSAGLYFFAARVQSEGTNQLLFHHLLVPPAPMKFVSTASRFGVNASHPEWAPLLRRLSVGWVRFENLKWPFFSPEPGVYRFDGSVKPWQVDLDKTLQDYTDEGLNVLPFLFETADYASSAPPGIKEDRRSFYPPTSPASFADFVFQVVARYGNQKQPAAELKTADDKSGLGAIHIFEIWNEPNLTDPGWGPWVGTSPQYLDLFRAAAEAVKRADPKARVTNGGFSGIQVKTVDELRTYTYADGKHPLDFVDVLNVHYYSGRVPPELATIDTNKPDTSELTAEEDFRRLAAWRDRYKPGMPIWLTETGYDSAGPYGTDERTQAARLPRMIMIALANGIDKVFVYRESGSTPSMHAASGLLRDDGSMKPSFLTYATLIRQLDGVKGGAVRIPYPDSNVRVYSWKGAGGTLLTAWTINGAGRLNLNLGRGSVTDAFGRSRSMDLSKGLDLSPFPVYIRGISNMSAIRALLG